MKKYLLSFFRYWKATDFVILTVILTLLMTGLFFPSCKTVKSGRTPRNVEPEPLIFSWEYPKGEGKGYTFHVFYALDTEGTKWQKLGGVEWPEKSITLTPRPGLYRITVSIPPDLGGLDL